MKLTKSLRIAFCDLVSGNIERNKTSMMPLSKKNTKQKKQCRPNELDEIKCDEILNDSFWKDT